MLVLPKWGASRGMSPPHARLPHSCSNSNVRLGGTPTFPAALVRGWLRRRGEGPGGTGSWELIHSAAMRRLSATLPAALLLLAAPACKDKPGTNVSVAPEKGDEASGRGGDGHVGTMTPRGPIEKIEVHGSVSGIADMLAAGTRLIAIWAPPEPGSPAMDLRALVSMSLIQQGFGPGFFDGLRLDDVHAFEFAYPQDGQPGTTVADIDLALALSASDPVRVIESLPAAMQPQPLGNNLWQMTVDEFQVYLRASADAVEVALAMEQLDRAKGLRQKVPAGSRLRFGTSNIPPGDIDIGELLPVPSKVLVSVLNETRAVEFVGDFGSDRDLSARLDVDAPFERLGLGPIGPATQGASELAEVLPGEAMAVWSMPWGDPRLLHDVLDHEIPVKQIPAPFDGYVGDVVAGSHAILDQVRDEVVVAAYLDNKQQLTLVLAVEVEDDAAARTAVREIWRAAHKAFLDHIALTGNSAELEYKVDFKSDAVKVGKAKADSFTLTLPKEMADDPEIDVFDSLVGRKNAKLELLTLVDDGKLIMTIGVGGRAIMADVGRRIGKPGGKDSLEAEGGLALARNLTSGCQYCIAVDPIEVMRMILTVIADQGDQTEAVRKVAREGNASLAKLGVEGQVAFSLRMEDRRGSLGMVVPKSLLFVDPAKAAKIIGIFKAVDEAKQQPTKTATVVEKPR